MKKKKWISAACLTLGLVLTATACSSGSSTSFSPNWYSTTGISNVVAGEEEHLTYSVALSEAPDYSKNYAVNYTNGSYTTHLTTVKAENEDKFLYVYSTELNLTVEFYYGGDKKSSFEDVITSEVVFDGVPSLRPIKSKKSVVSHSPLNDAVSEQALFSEYNYTVEIEYTYGDEASGKSVYTDRLQNTSRENTFEIPDKYTYIDNEELLFALRGVSFSNSYQLERNNSTARGTSVQVVKATPGSAASDEFSFEQVNGSNKKNIEYYPVEIALAERNPGTPQTAWYAASKEFRNVLLRLETPIYYNNGTLVYTLQKAVFTKQ